MPTHVTTTKPFPLCGTLGVDVTVETSSVPMKLGTKIECDDGNTYILVQANGAIDAYAACALDEGHEVAELTTASSGAVPTVVVVPQIAITDDYYAWAVLKGKSFSVLALASCALNVKVYTTSTPGAIDDSASGTDLIQGLRLNATNGGSTAATAASAENGMFTNAQD